MEKRFPTAQLQQICPTPSGVKSLSYSERHDHQDADIYLLDDPLSAVDSRVSRHIFEKTGKQFLKGKLRVLVTHQLQYLPQADHIIVLNAGKIAAQGTYKELVEQKIVRFVSLMTSETEEDSKKAANESSGKELLKIDEADEAGKPEAVGEQMAGGSVTGRTYWNYFKSGGSYFGMFMLAVVGFILSQVLYSISDYWLSYWTTAGRPSAASPATGSKYTYNQELKHMYEVAFK